ncbi:UPK3A protein, partial [Xiphorhynchus elegans]|nr:UPK3A protein [Xiphorhynchus elegans]
DQSLKPQIAAPQLAKNNPTLTTVALEKPFCLFDSSLHPNKSYTIYLYAMKESGEWHCAPLEGNCEIDQCMKSFTAGWKWSKMSVQYLFRVGDDGTCLYDPNFFHVYNPPLTAVTTYRFKYVLIFSTEGIVKDQTLWTDPIKTRRGKSGFAQLNWPGQRSGDMIVITSILSVLVSLLLAGFLTSVEAFLLPPRRPEGPSAETKSISQTPQQSDLRLQLSSE